jgi:hypothetical protein
MRQCGILTDASDGVDGGVDAVGSGQRRSAARVVRRSVAALSERDTRDGAVGRRLSGVIAFTKWLSAK